ncbi:hypothetical protein F2Q70_00017031 [Brassica cretica]|uniref:Uncharacterized protein n=1 Tax=Brassica cretica TaxID=69181 RepID=A0A8S9I5T9_BRACR|nr:hypothetical protein F2Q70_00017031 [Brassica cretica]
MVPKVGYHSYTEDTGVEVSRTGRDQVELAGRADSRDGRTRRRAQPHDGSARRRADRRVDWEPSRTLHASLSIHDKRCSPIDV